VTDNFVPVKVHIKENRDQFRRFTSKWTPTIMIVDGSGKEFFRTEGWLPPRDFLAQMMIGFGRALFLNNKPKEAEKSFAEVADHFADTDFAPEAEYWRAVSQYRATADHKYLDEVARALANKYPYSNWTKRASVWGH
jgi:thioredoxin-related protein